MIKLLHSGVSASVSRTKFGVVTFSLNIWARLFETYDVVRPS